MAFSNTYDTTNPGSGVSNREDLSSKVSRVVPEKTPIFSLAPKGKCSATFPEWTVDNLKTPSTMANGISEGADVSSFSDQYENRAKLGNYIQVFRDDWMVSRLQQTAASAGPADVANAKAKAFINTKLGVEYAISSDNDRQADTGAGSPYLTRGLGDWIDSAGPSDVPAAFRTPSASISANGASITEAQFQAVIGGLFSASGEVSNSTLVAASGLRTAVAAFTRTESSTDKVRTYSVNEDATSKKLTFAVNFFDTDYGMVSILNANPDCVVDTDRGYFLAQEHYAVLSYYPMGATDLEDQGGGRRGFVDVACSLKVSNPRGLAKIN